MSQICSAIGAAKRVIGDSFPAKQPCELAQKRRRGHRLKSDPVKIPYVASLGGESVDKHVHMLKLSVGTDSVETLIDWQRRRSQQVADGAYYHITRMWPKRTDEILAGGSMYWVIGGLIQARQKITGFREIIGEDGIRRCGIVMERDVIRTEVTPKRPFQGWRYLAPGDQPRDLAKDRPAQPALPPQLAAALADIGVR